MKEKHLKPKFICTLSLVLVTCIALQSMVFAFDETRKQQLEDENTRLTEVINQAKQGQTDQATQIAAYDEKKAVVTQQIQETNNQVSHLVSEISVQKEAVAQKETEIQETREQLKIRIRALYTAGEASFWDIILNSNDVVDFFDKAYMMKTVSDHDNMLIANLQTVLNEYEEEVQTLEGTKADLDIEKASLANSELEYNNLIAESNALLGEYSQQEQQASGQYSQNTAELEALNAEIERYYAQQKAEAEARAQAEAQAEAQAQAQAEAAQQTKQSSSSNNNRSDPNPTPIPTPTPTPTPVTNGTYVWPVPGFYTISSPFGENRGYSHGGIDIAGGGINGAAIVAAASGTVSTSWYANGGWGGGYGTYCMIDHAGGRSTLYGHMSSIVVSPGQSVSQGQVIGYVGSTGESTGPHLHFETRLWGVKYDPMSEF